MLILGLMEAFSHYTGSDLTAFVVGRSLIKATGSRWKGFNIFLTNKQLTAPLDGVVYDMDSPNTVSFT